MSVALWQIVERQRLSFFLLMQGRLLRQAQMKAELQRTKNMKGKCRDFQTVLWAPTLPPRPWCRLPEGFLGACHTAPSACTTSSTRRKNCAQPKLQALFWSLHWSAGLPTISLSLRLPPKRLKLTRTPCTHNSPAAWIAPCSGHTLPPPCPPCYSQLYHHTSTSFGPKKSKSH